MASESSIVGRLAPSPTGAQHVGNARTYLLAWLSVRSRGGRLVLRIEDIDSPRVKPWATQQALDDLKWLGLDWDEGPDRGGPHQPYVQTQRVELYHSALEQLKAAEQVYPCTCTRSDVAAAASAPHVGQEGPIYPKLCAARRVADAETLGSQPVAWRFRTDRRTLNGSKAEAGSAELSSFNDLIAGPQSCRISNELGDFVVGKMDGAIAYQLAVVVDDHAMGVTEVIRGDDLLPSAFRQLELYDFFGWQPPSFGHVPLVVGEDGRRLAKRHGDTRLSVLRERGYGPELLIGLLAWSLGLSFRVEPMTASSLLGSFDLQRVAQRREPFVLTNEYWQALLENSVDKLVPRHN